MAKPGGKSGSVIEFRPPGRTVATAVERALPAGIMGDGSVQVVRPTAIDLSGRRKCWFFIGRGKTGKTTLARYVTEEMDRRGGTAVVAACDPVNRSLRRFMSGVAEPPSTDSEETKNWMLALLHAVMAEKGPSALVDLGGGNSALTALLAQVPNLAEIMTDAGVDPVAVYLVGSDPDDLTPLEISMAQGFRPRATAVVLNEIGGRRHRFDAVANDPVMVAARDAGAVQLWMPALWAQAAEQCNARAWRFREVSAVADPITAASVYAWLKQMDAEFEPIRSWWPE